MNRSLLALGAAIITALGSPAYAATAAPPASGNDALVVLAAQQGMARMVEELLSKGAAVDAADAEGNTALIWAAQQGRVPVVELLLARGANVTLRGSGGYDALLWATHWGHQDVVRVLLAAGANPYERVGDRPSAFDLATRAGKTELIGLMQRVQVRRALQPALNRERAPRWVVWTEDGQARDASVRSEDTLPAGLERLKPLAP